MHLIKAALLLVFVLMPVRAIAADHVSIRLDGQIYKVTLTSNINDFQIVETPATTPSLNTQARLAAASDALNKTGNFRAVEFQNALGDLARVPAVAKWKDVGFGAMSTAIGTFVSTTIAFPACIAGGVACVNALAGFGSNLEEIERTGEFADAVGYLVKELVRSARENTSAIEAFQNHRPTRQNGQKKRIYEYQEIGGIHSELRQAVLKGDIAAQITQEITSQSVPEAVTLFLAETLTSSVGALGSVPMHEITESERTRKYARFLELYQAAVSDPATYLFSDAVIKGYEQILGRNAAQDAGGASVASGKTVLILVDTSGSMESNDPKNLRAVALRKIIHTAPKGTKIAVVDFDSHARLVIPPTVLDAYSGSTRQDLLAGGLALKAEGDTNIGAALALAASKVVNAADTSVLLLSDGQDSNWSGSASPLPNGVKVYAIALSDDADRASLQAVASKTGAIFDIARSADDLDRLFQTLFSEAAGNELLMLSEDTIHPGKVHSYQIAIEPGTAYCEFDIAWPGSDLDIILTAPDGTIIDTDKAVRDGIGVETATFDKIVIESPQAGLWSVAVKAVKVDAGGEPYSVRASASPALSASGKKAVKTNWSTPPKPPRAGKKTPIAVSAPDVNWTSAKVTIWAPDGTLLTRSKVTPGADGKIDLPETEREGPHRIHVTVEGTHKEGHTVNRSFDRTLVFKEASPAAKSVLEKEPVASSNKTPKPAATPKAAHRSYNANEIFNALSFSSGFDGRRINLDIQFELGSAKLTPLASRQLDELAAAMKRGGIARDIFEVAGHTDSTGATDRNLDLSRERSASVVGYLTGKHGLDAAKIVATGYGERLPRDGLASTAGFNRRVEIINHGQWKSPDRIRQEAETKIQDENPVKPTVKSFFD